jgi:hypothetical protein
MLRRDGRRVIHIIHPPVRAAPVITVSAGRALRLGREGDDRRTGEAEGGSEGQR